MKPSGMAHFQAFTGGSAAGHGIILREKAGHPRQHPHPAGLSVAARQPLGDVWVSDVRGEARCCSCLSAPLRVRGTGQSPPNPLVILYSLKLRQQILPQAPLQNREERLKGSRGQHAVQSSLFR